MRNTNHWFLDVHAIQTLPPSNINRDDAGSPKTAQYGGVLRARVSSQAWKSVMRRYFREHGGKANVGVRTLRIAEYVANKMRAMDDTLTEEGALKKAVDTIEAAGIKTKEAQTRALFFLGDRQALHLAEAALAGEKDKKVLKQILKENPAIDIALFGRMLADDPNLNEDASAQVAHAVSTHAVQTEFDFYTGVDDLAPEGNAGAGMLGTVEFNAATYYRYANVAVHELLSQIGNPKDTVNTLKLFVEAFANSLPTGKVNAFAHQTVPQALLLVLRSDRPVNLISAFEKPVRSDHGYVDSSIKKMLEEMERVEKFVHFPVCSLLLTTDTIENTNAEIQTVDSLSAMMDVLGQQLQNVFTSTEKLS